MTDLKLTLFNGVTVEVPLEGVRVAESKKATLITMKDGTLLFVKEPVQAVLDLLDSGASK